MPHRIQGVDGSYNVDDVTGYVFGQGAKLAAFGAGENDDDEDDVDDDDDNDDDNRGEWSLNPWSFCPEDGLEWPIPRPGYWVDVNASDVSRDA